MITVRRLFTYLVCSLLAPLLGAVSAQAQIVDFTKAIPVDTGIYAASLKFDAAGLYAINISKGAESPAAVSAFQQENSSDCKTVFQFIIYDSFKRVVEKSYKDYGGYKSSEIYTEDLSITAAARGFYYVYVIPTLDPNRYFGGVRETCKANSQNIAHDVTISIETKGNTPTGPGTPIADSQKQCLKIQKYTCRLARYKREWTAQQTRQCIAKRKKRYCGL